MANINTDVEVKHSKSTTQTDIYTITFDGAVIFVDDNKPSDEFLLAFKKGVLAERERIWDEGSYIEDSLLRKILHQNE